MRLVQDAEVWTDQLKFLKNKDPRVRRAAATNLGRLGAEAKFAIAPLRQRLTDADPRVRCGAATALCEIGPAAVDEMIQALTLPDKLVRREAVWGLAKIGKAAAPAIPALARRLADRDASVRKGAARALGLLGHLARPAIPFLIRSLGDTDLLFCRMAAWALGKIGPAAVDALIAALNHHDKYVRREAAWALGQMGPEAAAAVPKLIAILKTDLEDSSESKDFSEPQVPKIQAHQDTEVVYFHPISDAALRANAAQALGQMGGEAMSAIPVLTAALADPSDKVAQAAAAAIDQLTEETCTGWHLKAAG
jgi:HEAT repeat protein